MLYFITKRGTTNEFYEAQRTFLLWFSIFYFRFTSKFDYSQSIVFFFFYFTELHVQNNRIKQQAVKFGAKFNSSFQTKPVHCSAFSDQTKNFQIVVPMLKYIILMSYIIPSYLSVELRYTLQVIRHTYSSLQKIKYNSTSAQQSIYYYHIGVKVDDMFRLSGSHYQVQYKET